MTTGPYEQRNPYRGIPPRAWVRIRLVAGNGTARELELVADTGCPQYVIISLANLAALKYADLPDLTTNFGPLVGGQLYVQMPELGLDLGIVGYGSDVVVSATQSSHADFEGLAGLPLLRLLEYGGNADSFWIRPLPASP